MKIAYFYPAGHEGHQMVGHPERPERVETIRTTLQTAGLWDAESVSKAREIDESVLKNVHTSELIETVRRHSEQPEPIDLDTYLTNQSFDLALKAAGGAAAVAQAVWRGEAKAGFALTRPPGHHATRDQAMGFCLFNNVALAAQTLIQNEGAKRIAILDMDVHHGNGTQDIFYERDDVFFLSTHQSPLWPGSGLLNERGRGKGEGFTCNLPLPPFSGDRAFCMAYGEIATAFLDRFKPEMLLVSFGFDAHWKDPLANLQVSAKGYGQAIRALCKWADENCNGRIAVMLEGGYDLSAAAACGVAVVQALLGLEITDELGPSPQVEGGQWMPALDAAKKLWRI